MLPVLMFSSILILFFSGFNGEGPLGTDAAGLTGVALVNRAAKTFCGLLMVCGVTYGAQSLLDGQTQTIQTGENNTDHEFASNETRSAYAHDHLTSTILGDPATAFWYSTMQTPAPYVNLDGTPLSHAAPDARKVEAPDAFQNLLIFAIFSVFVSVFVYFCYLLLYRILQFLFEGVWPPVQTQNANAMGFQTLNVNPVNQMPTDPLIKNRLDEILNAVRTTPTRAEVRPGSGDLGNQRHDTLRQILSAITSNNTSQIGAMDLLSAGLKEILSWMKNMGNIKEKKDGRFQESNSELPQSSGNIQIRLAGFEERYKDQRENNTKSEQVKSKLQTLDSNIHALSETVEELSNNRIGALEGKFERLNKSIKANNTSDSIQALEAKFEQLNKFVRANNSDSKVQAFGASIEKLSNQASKALTVDSLQFKALNDRVIEILSQVSGAPIEFLDLQDSTQRLTQKVEILERGMQKASNVIGNYQTLETEIGEIQHDILTLTARRSDVRSVHGPLKKIQEELQTINDMSGKVQEIQEDVSTSSHNGGDVRSSNEQLEKMQQELQKINGMPGKFQVLSEKIQGLQEEVRQKHDSIVSRLEANVRSDEWCSCQYTLAKMQEELQLDKDMPERFQDLSKEIQEVREEVNCKHNSIESKLEANRCTCQGTLVKMPEELPEINDVPGNVQDLSQEIENIREEVQKEHTSAVSKLEVNLQNLDERLTSQETRVDEMNEEHQKLFSTHEDGLSNLRMDIDTIEAENKKSLEDLRQEISRADPNLVGINDLIQQIADETIQLRMTANWDDLRVDLKAILNDELKQQDFRQWKDRVEIHAHKVEKLEESIEQSGCRCNAVDLAGNTGILEESVKERLAEHCAEWKEKIETELRTLKQDLEFFEGARADNGERLEKVDERLKGIEDQFEKTNNIFLEKFSNVIEARYGEDQQESRDQKLEELANKIKEDGLGIHQLLYRVEKIYKRLDALIETVQGDGSIKADQSGLEQLDTLKEEYLSLWEVFNLPGVQKALQEYNRTTSQNTPFTQQTGAATDQVNVESQSTAFQPDDQQAAPSQQSIATANENVGQQTPAPTPSNAPMAPQSSPVSQPIFRYQALGDPDEIPPEMRAILARVPPREASVSYASPVLQTATTTGKINVVQQAPLPYQPHARDSPVIQPDVSSPTASAEQTTAPQERPTDVPGRKIKVPMSRKKSYQKEQQQQQQRQQQPQQQQQQQQHEQQQQNQQPLTTEGIIDTSQLADTTTIEPTAQENITQQPPSPPQMGAEAQAMLEAEVAERVQPPIDYDDLFDDFPEIPGISEALDEEERRLEEKEKREEEERRRGRNVPLSLPGIVQVTDVLENTQAETSQAAAQVSLNIPGESSIQDRGTAPAVQRDVAPLVETSKKVESSKEQRKASETTEQKSSSSSSSQRLALSQSRWADVPNDSAPQDKSSGSVKTSGEQKKTDETVKQQSLPSQGKSSIVSQSVSKHTDKVPQGKTTSNPAKTSGDTRKEPGATITRTIKPRPLPLPFTGQSMSRSQLADRQRGPAPQVQTASNPRKTSEEQKIPSQATRKPSQSQEISLSDSRWGKKEDDVAPKDKTTSNPAAEDSGKSKETAQTVKQVSSNPQGTSSNNSLGAKEKDDRPPKEGAASDPAEEVDGREVRQQAVVDAFASYKGKSMHESRWADPPEKKEEPSKKEETREAVDKAYSKAKGKGKSVGDNLPAMPEKWRERASKNEAKSSPAETPSKREEEFQAVKGAWKTVKGKSLTESRWATTEDEKEDTAPTPKSESESSPFGGSHGRNKVRNVYIRLLSIPQER
jgi:DNA repair exonuclease SbcCD ATPase subunit